MSNITYKIEHLRTGEYIINFYNDGQFMINAQVVTVRTGTLTKEQVVEFAEGNCKLIKWAEGGSYDINSK